MLHLILRAVPAPLHRLAYRIASRALVLWKRRFKRPVQGSQVIAFDAAGRIAFVRLSYGFPGWTLPGGGLGRSEDPVEGGRREFREETGCELTDAVLVDITEETSHGAPNRVHLITGRAVGELTADRREVLEARWFAPDALPGEMPARMRQAIPGWIIAAKAADRPAGPLPLDPPPDPTG